MTVFADGYDTGVGCSQRRGWAGAQFDGDMSLSELTDLHGKLTKEDAGKLVRNHLRRIQVRGRRNEIGG